MSNTRISLNALLPHAYPFLLIDRVLEFEAGKRAVCLKNISCNEAIIKGTHPDRPFFPTVYIIEAMAQTCGLLMPDEKSGGGVLSMIRDAKLHGIVTPGDQLIITSTLFHAFSPLFVFEVRAGVNDLLVADAEITLAATEKR